VVQPASSGTGNRENREESSMNKVYGVALSPFVRKVLIVLEYKGIAYDNEMVLPFSKDPQFLRRSPLGKIPAYEDEYVTLADSSVICQYLEDKYPDHPLYPRHRVERAKALWFEEYCDSHLREVLVVGFFLEKVVKPKLLRQPTDEAKVRRTLTVTLPKTLDYLESVLPASGYLFSSGLSIADVSLASMFLNARYAGYEIPADRWPRSAGYIARVLAHPVFVQRIANEADLARALA
jgi:glutathione S-transferase